MKLTTRKRRYSDLGIDNSSMTVGTIALLAKFHKPPMSLKQFMLRSEVIKLYRGFMKLRRLIDLPPASSSSTSTTTAGSAVQANCNSTSSPLSVTSKISPRTLHPLQLEWVDWVRSEFRLRQETNDEEAVKMMLSQGKRQLKELERTILLATNRNLTENSANISDKTEGSNSQ